MLRRTVLQWLATLPVFRAWAQTATFPGKHRTTLRELAVAVLPSDLGASGVDRVVEEFEQWVRDYRSGADMDHGYGFTRIRSKPASPAPMYLAQLEALQQQTAERRAIEAALEKAGVKELPRLPDGKHVISDLMSFYFHGSEANDLCYRAAIERYHCRGLQGSDDPPPQLKGKA